MIRKITLVLILTLFFFFLSGDFSLPVKIFQNENSSFFGQKNIRNLYINREIYAVERPLEIPYPQIPGVPTPQTVATGLPDYVKYIFNFAVVSIGVVIFGVIVYSGVRYFFSFGNPARLSDAKEGIISGFLGGIILLGAYLIFNTINPQLTTFKLEPVPTLRGMVTPGIYVCNYDVTKSPPGDFSKFGNLEEVLIAYIDRDKSNPDRQVEATKVLSQIILKNENEFCQLMRQSDNFTSIIRPEYTIFAIPEIEEVIKEEGGKVEIERQPKFNFAIIIYEKENFKGTPWLFPPVILGENKNFAYLYGPTGGGDYQFNRDGMNYKLSALGDKVGRSAIVLQKPEQKDLIGVTLFSCFNYNEMGFCPKIKKSGGDESGGGKEGSESDEDESVKPVMKIFNTDQYDSRILTKEDLGELYENVRSLRISPEGSFIVTIFENEDPSKGNQWTFLTNQADINILEVCGNRCNKNMKIVNYLTWWRYRETYCIPCVRLIWILKARKL